MIRRDLIVFLLLELVAVVWAGASFALIESKLIAGFVAGAYFILSAAWMLNRVRTWPRPGRALTLYPLLIHLFGVSIPMVVTRALNTDQEFGAVRILGLEGPVFHRISTTVFGALVAATVVDLVRTIVTNRSRRA